LHSSNTFIYAIRDNKGSSYGPTADHINATADEDISVRDVLASTGDMKIKGCGNALTACQRSTALIKFDPPTPRSRFWQALAITAAVMIQGYHGTGQIRRISKNSRSAPETGLPFACEPLIAHQPDRI